MPSKVLITGATGLVGSKLTQFFIAQGIEVNYLTTNTLKLNKNGGTGYFWDIKNKEFPLKALEGVTTIIHLAGATISKPWTTAYKEEIIQSRVASILLIKQILEQHKHTVSHFITASAIGIYPDSYTVVYTETTVLPKQTTSFLATTVKQWEKAVDKIATLNIKVTKIRTGLVLDKNQGAFPKIIASIPYRLGVIFGSGKQYQSWITSSDLVALYFFVYKHQLTGIYNAVAPEIITNKKLMQQIGVFLNTKLLLLYVPSFVLRLFLGERSNLLLCSQNVNAKKIQEKGFQFNQPTIYKALKNLL